MLDDKGNTAVYLLYMYTRIKSISRSAQVDENQLRDKCENEALQLNHEKEWKLAKVSSYRLQKTKHNYFKISPKAKLEN